MTLIEEVKSYNSRLEQVSGRMEEFLSPASVSATGQLVIKPVGREWESRGFWIAFSFIVLLLLGLISTGLRRVPLMTLTHSSSTAALVQPRPVDGVIVELQLSFKTPMLHVTTMDGQEMSFKLSPYATSVFRDGVVLSPTHLRLGELVRVASTLQKGTVVAQSIEILKTPQEMELGPRGVSGRPF